MMMMLDEEFENLLSDYHARQLTRFPASHHSAPLTYYPQRHVVEIISGNFVLIKTNLLLSLKSAAEEFSRKNGGKHCISYDPSLVYCYFLENSRLDNLSDNIHRISGERLRQFLTLSRNDLLNDLRSISNFHPGLPGLDKLANLTDESLAQISVACSRVMRCKEMLEELRHTIQQNHISKDESLTTVIETRVVKMSITREMAYFILPKAPSTIIMLNFDQVLMLLDTVSCRLMTRVTTMINDILGYDNLPSWGLIQQIYQWGDDLIARHLMPAYSVVGEFESIITGIFVTFQDSDPLDLGKDFLESIMITASENEEVNGVPAEETMKLIEILRGVKSINWLSEIFGLRKHWGNPMVDAKASGSAVQEKIAEVLPVKGPSLIKLLASFNRMIILEYINKHGSWPEGHFPEEADFPIKDSCENNVCRIPETDYGHHHSQWALFKFGCNSQIDSYKDDLRLISDKSVSVYRSHLDSTYVKRMCKVELPSEVQENRRLILEYLRTQHLSILEIFKVVMTDSIPNEWLANCSAMKGTEMKYLKARIFAVLTYELRQYFAATEDIIKNSIFKYNPHQTMTLSETDLLKKLRSITTQLDPSNDSRWLYVMHIVDFSKWNLRMRYVNTSSVFKSIDDFLGTPGLVERTHIVFANMLNIVQDAFNPPEDGVLNTESETVWRNHTCGWEGQRQKGWTMLTSAVLSDLVRITGVKSTICGQGDNQTLLAQFPVPDAYRNPADWISRDPKGVRLTIDSYYKRLESECADIGLKVKTAETCRSLSYFNYGKRLYFNGVELSMTLKRISKIITEPNDSYPTTENILKTLEGSALASGLYSHPSVLPYFISRLSTYSQLYVSFTNNQLIGSSGIDMLKSENISFNSKFLGLLAKIPASLGGPPQMQLAAFLFRGHPDPLCADLVMLKLRAANGCNISARVLSIALSGKWFNNKRTSKESLIMSPYSLNLDVPTSAREPLDKAILPALRENCFNQLVSDMFSTQVDDISRNLLNSLSTLTPFQPLVANDIYSRSLPGRRQTFISGLANTTSLGRLIYESSDNPMIFQIQQLEKTQIYSWITKVMDVDCAVINTEVYNTPHHELAQIFRDRSWNTQIVGVTVPHPLEQFAICMAVSDVCSDECNKHQPEHIVMVKHGESIITLPGVDGLHVTSQRSKNGSPYLGSSIAEGIVQKQIICTNPDTTWKDLIRLNTVRKWVCIPGSDLDSLLLGIIQSRTDVPLETLDQATGIPSRLSYSHRASLQPTVHTCNVSSTTNMPSKIYISSNRMGEYSHGEYNFHMPFGPAFLCAQELLCLKGLVDVLQWESDIRDIVHLHVRDKTVPKVFDGKLNVLENHLMAGNSFAVPVILYSSTLDLIFEAHSGAPGVPPWTKAEEASLLEAKYGYCFQLIADSFVKETVVRETITQEHVSSFVPRPSQISIGDISMVSVRIFIRSLAWNSLLLGPISMWCCSHPSGFSVRAYAFLSNFSIYFWENFSSPLSNNRLSEKFFGLYPLTMSAHSTQNSAAMKIPIMKAVIIEMWSIKKEFESNLRSQSGSSPLPLFAPSLPAVRLLYSKLIEFAVYSSLHLSGIDTKTCLEHSRDFSANTLCTRDEDFYSMQVHLFEQFKLVSKSYNIHGMYLPNVKFFSLQYPWVDRLRYTTMISPALPSSTYHTVPENYPPSGDNVLLHIPEVPVRIVLSGCNCPPSERVALLHSECFFSTSGILSKSHLKFLDLVFSNRLNIEGVVVLGSSTGTEALGFAKFESCKSVYVNCYIPLTQFSQHIAGSYVPAAFAEGHHLHKLVRSSSAAICNSDLLKPETIGDISNHLKSTFMTGITCDAEMPDEKGYHNVIQLLKNINKLVTELKGIEWVIVKVPFQCHHDVIRYISVLSVRFKNIKPTISPYSRPGLSLLHLVCTFPRVDINNETLDPAIYIPVTLLEGSSISHLTSTASNSRVQAMFASSIRDTIGRLACLVGGDNSFPVACCQYIPGWNLVCSSIPKLEDFRREIKSVIDAINSQVSDMLRVSFIAFRSDKMPRNSILHISTDPLHKSLNDAFELRNRAELLQTLLDIGSFDFFQAQSIIINWINKDHYYDMTTRKFQLQLNVTRFINITSRYLYEILGHFFQRKFTVNAPKDLFPIYHTSSARTKFLETDAIWRGLDLTTQIKRFDLKWSWRRRAEVLFWLTGAYLLAEPIKILTEHSFLIDEFHVQGKLLDLTHAVEFNSTVRVVDIRNHRGLESLVSLQCERMAIRLPLNLCSILHNYTTILSYHKCAWSGVFPNEVIVLCDPFTPSDKTTHLYPDFDTTVNSVSETGLGFLDCACWDCSAESILCDHFKITHGELDRFCSLKHVESVRDTDHVL